MSYARLIIDVFISSVRFICKDDKNHGCTEWILKYSAHFSVEVAKCNIVEGPIEFRCEEFNLETIQAYLAHMHGRLSGKVEVGLCVDLLNFLSCGQKTGKLFVVITNYY